MITEKYLLSDGKEIVPSKKKIYIVDDVGSVRRSLKLLMSSYGFEVETFNSSEDFFTAVPKSAEGCLILDIHMPGLNGWDTQQRLKNAGYELPVIVITADNDNNFKERALKAGAVGFLQKPFEDHHLLHMVNFAFKKRTQTILIVEDDLVSARLLSSYLTGAGYVIEFAVNGEEAVLKARYLKPDLITLDIVMPKKDGWDVIAELKMDPITKNIPVIITSGLEEQEKGFALGAAGYITKPIEKESFEDILNKIDFPEIFQETIPYKVLIIDDEPTSLAIIANILSKKGMHVIKAGGGREGLVLAAQESPNLIVLDLLMPEVTGFEVLYQLKHHPFLSDIPVIVLTVKELTISERESLFQHAKAIIPKAGFNKEVFLKNVAQALIK
jgi:CheY-like chemotaxis protein